MVSDTICFMDDRQTIEHLKVENNKTDSVSRVASIDALRGFDMFFIMGGAELIMSICALWPNAVLARALRRQMIHSEWNGLRFYDCILPLFLFIAGLSFPYSLHRQRAKGDCDKLILLRVLKRSILLILLGVVYNGFLYEWSTSPTSFRFVSVLGRLGIAWGVAAIIFTKNSPKKAFFISSAILVLYWICIGILPRALELGNPYTISENLVARIDRHLVPGRLYYDSYDPEGLVAAIPSVVTVLSGMLSSNYLSLSYDDSYNRGRFRNYLLVALALLVLGLLWSNAFPINKNMWSSSFVCVTSGICMILFVLLCYLVDVQGCKKIIFPLRVIGMNAITIYLVQAVLSPARIIEVIWGRILERLPDVWAEIVVWGLYVSLCWIFLFWLYRKKLFFKI